VKLGADYFFDAYGNYSPYVGAGLSLSSNTLHIDDREFSGWGLNAELAAGYELFRASTIRLLIQANASLPTYRLSTRDHIYDASGVSRMDGSNKYAPIFGITLGIGWGKPREVSIVKIRQED
jgi:outer membrane protein W